MCEGYLSIIEVMRISINERRRFYRIDLAENVYLEFADRSYDSCHTQNLSLGGMNVAGEFSQQKGENCQVYIYHNPESGEPCLNGSAQIIWTSGKGIGLAFTAMTYKNSMLLLSKLINNTDKSTSELYNYSDDFPFEVKKP